MALTKGFKIACVAIVAAGLVSGYVYWKGHHQAPTEQFTDNMPLQSQVTQSQTVPPVQTASFQSSKDTLKSLLSNGVVRISVQNPSEPFYGVVNNEAHGFNVEFAKLLFAQPEFKSQGKSVQVDTAHAVTTYADVPKQLLANDPKGNPLVDIAMDGLTFPDNTPNGVSYSVPYIDDFGYALIVGPGSRVRSAVDLNGKTVGILQGDPDVKTFVQRMYPASRITEVSDADPDFIAKSIDNHVVDAFVYDYPFAVESLKNTDLKFAVTKLDGSDIAYKIGVRSNDQSLLIYLNSAIAKVKSTTAYLDLLRKYFISTQVVTTAAVHGERSYTVRQGDTLNLIASSQLGAGNRYAEIQRRNNLPNPNLIMVGQVLVIPAR